MLVMHKGKTGSQKKKWKPIFLDLSTMKEFRTLNGKEHYKYLVIIN